MEDIISKWKSGLNRTRKKSFGRLATLVGATDITDETWDELEEILIQADVGVETSLSIIDNIKYRINNEGVTQHEEFQSILRNELIDRLLPLPLFNFQSQKTNIILIVGVNGSGKTTTIAKLGNHFKAKGNKVLFAAADTYRAAATEQLAAWGEQLDIPILAGQQGGDPGAVAYDAVQSAITREMDYVIVDTAGRLHTRFNLMEELKKVYRVIVKAKSGAPDETWLVMDATTGQNAIHQAIAFKEAVNVSGIILAKLDSSAKGGMAFAIQKELGLPILFVGLGEKPQDLELFSREAFVDGILSNN